MIEIGSSEKNFCSPDIGHFGCELKRSDKTERVICARGCVNGFVITAEEAHRADSGLPLLFGGENLAASSDDDYELQTVWTMASWRGETLGQGKNGK